MSQFNQHAGGFDRHYDEITCLQYLEGLLDRPTARELSAHTDQCTDCRELMHALERESRLLSNALREQEEAVPAHLLAGPVRDKTPWAWVASFGLAAAGVYWLWTSFIDPAMAQASEAGFGSSDLLTTLFFHSALWKGWPEMWTLIQGAAVVSLSVIGIFLLRRSLRKFNTIAVVMTALLVALGMPSGASAAEIHRHESHYTLPAGAVVKDDLIVFGDSVQIDGTVDGDLIAFGRNLTITGHITGDVISFGAIAQISGTIDGSVRSFSNQIMFRGKIGKNLTAFSNQVETDAQSTIGWGATLFVGGDATLNGRIERSILAYTAHMDINGFVGGNTILTSNESFTVGPQAQTMGKIEYTGTLQPEVSSSAKLASPVETTIEVHKVDWYAGITYWHKLLFWGAGFVFGLVMLLIAPGFFTETVQTANRFGASLGIGVLTIIAVFIVAVLICFTVVGLGVGIATLLLWLIAMYCSHLFVATWLGRKLVGKNSFVGVVAGKKMWPVPYKGALIGQFALGLLLLDAIRMIPYVGLCAAILAQVWGFGALALTIYHRIHPGVSSTIEAAPVTA
jgi:cytoskeletal protein CcmA (bactofilin family)